MCQAPLALNSQNTPALKNVCTTLLSLLTSVEHMQSSTYSKTRQPLVDPKCASPLLAPESQNAPAPLTSEAQNAPTPT